MAPPAPMIVPAAASTPVPTPVQTSAPPPAPPPQQRTSKAWLIGVPVAILILIGIIWATMAGMPFGGSRSQNTQIRQTAPPAMDTISEGTSTAATASIGDTQDMQSRQPVQPPPPPPMTTTTTPTATTTIPMTSGAPAAPPAVPVPVQRQPQPVQAPPPPSPQPRSSEISETEARAILARFLDARDPYHTPGNCLVVRGTGYSNRGFAFDVLDHCQSQHLGNWRVDSVTRELFEQKADGRYLRP
jgi:hypothetical protein